MTIPSLIFANNPGVPELYKWSADYILTPENLIELRHQLVVEKLNEIQSVNPAVLLKKVGFSAEGRSVNMLSFGEGEKSVLLWSQMHGDEPTATAGLLAVFNFLARNFDSPFVRHLYKKLTIHAIVMLNPDGAERFIRQNAQGIDINRDANRLSTPEGQILKKMHDQIHPHYGFNLHDMRGRETVGQTGEMLSIALMAPPFNEANEDSPSRLRAKKLAVLIRQTLEQLIPGHIARYKADYMPRAFGDAFQNWGVSTVLVESGLSKSTEPHHLVRLNFVLLLDAFAAIAGDRVAESDAALYEAIPLEGPEIHDLVIKNAFIYNGRRIAPYPADIGINVDFHRRDEGIIAQSVIDEIGEISATKGRSIIDAAGLIVIPGFILQGDPKATAGHFKQGITTVISDPEAALPVLPRDGRIDPQQIPLFTADVAKALNLTDLGLIDKEMKADLLIFEPTGETLNLKNLRYVIKEGRIVYKR